MHGHDDEAAEHEEKFHAATAEIEQMAGRVVREIFWSAEDRAAVVNQHDQAGGNGPAGLQHGDAFTGRGRTGDGWGRREWQGRGVRAGIGHDIHEGRFFIRGGPSGQIFRPCRHMRRYPHGSNRGGRDTEPERCRQAACSAQARRSSHRPSAIETTNRPAPTASSVRCASWLPAAEQDEHRGLRQIAKRRSGQKRRGRQAEATGQQIQ